MIKRQGTVAAYQANYQKVNYITKCNYNRPKQSLTQIMRKVGLTDLRIKTITKGKQMNTHYLTESGNSSVNKVFSTPLRISLSFILLFSIGASVYADPVPIENVQDLQDMRDDLDGDYFLAHDIDASETAEWNHRAGFIPIGDENNHFTGTFDGRRHVIVGLYMNRQGDNDHYIGLFGFIEEATIENVGVVDADVTSRSYSGGLVALSYHSSITNCFATGGVNGGSGVGGLVGYLYRGSITDSYANVSVNNTHTYVGGLVGQAYRATLRNSYATGSVVGGSRVGGFVGSNDESTISNSYATGSVEGGMRVGGLIGENSGSSVSNCYATGRVNCDRDAGGLVGITDGNNYTNNFWNTETTGKGEGTGAGNRDGIRGLTTEQMQRQATFENAGWDFNEIWVMSGYPHFQWESDLHPGIINGFVFEALNDEALENVIIRTSRGQVDTTDVEGFFEIIVTPDVEFDFTASLPNYVDSTLIDQSVERDDTLQVTFHLSRYCVVEGCVFDVLNNEPVQNALVVSSMGVEDRTDEDGLWEFRHIPANGLNIIASAHNYVDSTMSDLNAERDDTLRATFYLSRYCFVEGYVLDALNDEPLENARVISSRSRSDRTDENGYWEFYHRPIDGLNFTASAPEYLDSTMIDLNAERNDTLRITFRLRRPLFMPSQDELVIQVREGESKHEEMFVRNGGNAELEWQTEIKPPLEFVYETYEYRQSFDLGEELNDAYLWGVIFLADSFYVAGDNSWISADDPNLIYVLDRDGDLVRSFEQPESDQRYGMRDLALDPENSVVWGAVGSNVYAMSLSGEVLSSFGMDFDVRNIAFDTDRGICWGADMRSRIIGFDAGGNVVSTLAEDGLRKFGLAYFPDDPDSCQLYVLHDEDERQQLYKINLEDNELMLATELALPAEGREGGIDISEDYDKYSTVLLEMTANGGEDRIDVWHLRTNLDWVSLDPLFGELEPNDSALLTISINASDLAPEVYETRLIFTHTGAGGTAEVLVTLNVTSLGVEDDDRTVASPNFGITSAYPNPFNHSTTIAYSLQTRSDVELRLCDLSGREVKSLVKGTLQAGVHQVILYAPDIPSGLYFVQLKTTDLVFTHKLMLVK